MDVSGTYQLSGQSIGSVVLTQDKEQSTGNVLCSGSSDKGWTYTISASTVTAMNGANGASSTGSAIAGANRVIISFSNSVTYTQQVDTNFLLGTLGSSSCPSLDTGVARSLNLGECQ